MDNNFAKIDLRSYEGDSSAVITERELTLHTLGFNADAVGVIYDYRPSLFDSKTVEEVIVFLRDNLEIEPVAAVMDYPGILSLGVEGLQNKFNELEGMGFSEPQRLFREMPRVVRFAGDTVRAKLETLSGFGFREPTRFIEGNPRIISFSGENIATKLRRLSELGIDDPVKFCEKCPDVLGYGSDSLKTRIVEIEAIGMAAVPALNKHPQLFMCSQERLQDSIDFLNGLGVKDPLKMLQRFPRVINYSHDNIHEKISELIELGITQPVRLIEKAPFILSNSSDTFAKKVDCLAECGFTAPGTMVEKNPSLLARAETAIRRRVRLVERLVNFYDLDYDAKGLLEDNPVLFNSSDKRLLMMVRIAASLVSTTEEAVPAKVAIRAAFLNVEAAIIASAKVTTQPTHLASVGEWIQKSKKVQSQMPSKKQKVEYVLGDMAIDPRIRQKYQQKFITK